MHERRTTYRVSGTAVGGRRTGRAGCAEAEVAESRAG